MVSARWYLWLSLLAACGGAVEEGPSDAPESGSEQPGPPPSDGSDHSDADTELGACELGRKEDWREPCRWVADGRCYAERAAACNCACPRSRNSQCASGFDDGPDGHVWVTCD